MQEKHEHISIFVSTGSNIKHFSAVACQDQVSLISWSYRTVITSMINSFSGIHSECQRTNLQIPARFLLGCRVCCRAYLSSVCTACCFSLGYLCTCSCRLLHQTCFPLHHNVSISQRRSAVATMCQHFMQQHKACPPECLSVCANTYQRQDFK